MFKHGKNYRNNIAHSGLFCSLKARPCGSIVWNGCCVHGSQTDTTSQEPTQTGPEESLDYSGTQFIYLFDLLFLRDLKQVRLQAF